MNDKLLCVLIISFSLCACFLGCCLDVCCSESSDDSFDSKNVSISNRTIYSWNREIFDESPDAIGNCLLRNNIVTIYQGLYPSDFSNPKLSEIVRKYRKQAIEIVYLVGDSSWMNSETVIFWALEPLVNYNKIVETKSRINKVCFDIEFFNSKAGYSFEDYTIMMREIYDFCHENSLEVIVCLPYWIPTVYGQVDFERLLDYMDVLSCSVFMVGKEEELLQPVAELCKTKKKKFEAILDLQPENEEYRVSTRNTYFHEGLQKFFITSEKLEYRYGCNASIHNLSEYRKFL